jgi:hypothetical protein
MSDLRVFSYRPDPLVWKATRFPRGFAHLARLRAHPAFAPDLEPCLAKLEAGAP